jgi:hypothetical protein
VYALALANAAALAVFIVAYKSILFNSVLVA